VGNQHARKARLWRDALKKELEKVIGPNGMAVGNVVDGLRVIAKQVVADAVAGNYTAIAEIANRLDGRPAQDVHVSGDDGGPVNVNTISDLELARRVLFDLHQAERAAKREH
jgi:hypothetical protein